MIGVTDLACLTAERIAAISGNKGTTATHTIDNYIVSHSIPPYYYYCKKHYIINENAIK
jgi:hypothetical protein